MLATKEILVKKQRRKLIKMEKNHYHVYLYQNIEALTPIIPRNVGYCKPQPLASRFDLYYFKIPIAISTLLVEYSLSGGAIKS